MQSNEIKKKLESKLVQIQRRIDEKEFEKSRKKQESKEKRITRETTKNDDAKLTSIRNEINNEISNINSELKREKDEMNRLYAELTYRTRNEYEDMIKRYEREMQFNHQSFRPNEEARILREICDLKKGINKLDEYETKKQDVSTLQNTLQVKRVQLNQNWSQHQQNNIQIRQINDEIKELKYEITQINEKDLPEMINLKNELKKQLEDLNREISAKHQQIKKESFENKKRNKALKQDEVLLSMEDTLRDLNKLINYYQKLVDSIPINECSNQQPIKSSTSNVSSSSSSLNASTNSSDLFEPKKLTLNLDETNKSSLLSEKSSHQTSNFSSPSSSTLTTPTSEQGSFLIRKSFEENRTKNQLKKSKQNKTNKLHHSVDIINLLVKYVPINLSSQSEKCLKELINRRETVLNQISIYESTNNQCSAQEQNDFELNSLDSNYESDNNSVKSFQSFNLLNIVNETKKQTNDKTIKCNNLEVALQIQVKLNNSDDSDSTLNESLTNLNETIQTNNSSKNSNNNILLKSSITKIAKIKISNDPSPQMFLSSVSISASSSDSTATPGSPKTPIPSFHTDNNNNDTTREESFDNLPSNTTTNADQPIVSQDLLNFKRQLSDGYSSSNTPLSASSINNETPSCNPFFSSSQNNL